MITATFELLRTARGEKTNAASGFDDLRAVEIVHTVYQGSETGKSVFFSWPEEEIRWMR